MAPRALIVDDERLIRLAVSSRCAREGFETLEADTGAAALAALRMDVDVVLLDYQLPDTNGLALLPEIKAYDAELPVILMTAYASVSDGIEAIKRGAYHYLCKPFDLEEMMLCIRQALEATALRRELRAFRARNDRVHAIDRMIGDSPAMQQVKQLLEKVSASGASTLLITGESGTGKDFAARVIHFNSARATHAFTNITCSAMPEALLESELFGHERGAFTDAKDTKVGLLEEANGGTVFLDEVGEMAPGLQAKLLRFLEERTFRRVGGQADIHVDVRVIAATNRDLTEAVRRGQFREDLYYRLGVIRIDVPPLRERKGDLGLLVAHYISIFNREFKKHIAGVAPEAMAALEAHTWPGNVRELRNSLERAMLLQDGDTLELESLLPLARPEYPFAFQLPPDGVRLDDLERDLVTQALERAGGNRTHAGRLLGMNRDQIRHRIEKYGLQAVPEKK